MKAFSFLFCAVSLCLAGCWTVSETEYPAAVVAAGNDVRVSLTGFRTNFRLYQFVEGHESMSGTEPDPVLIGPDRIKQTEVSWMAEKTASGMLASRVVAELKRKGYVMDMKTPQYVIDVAFAGPVFPDYDVLRQLGYGLCTLFTAENMIVTWTASLKVRDGATRKVLFRKDYEQTYDVTVWGPIPVASPACNARISDAGANSWALTALTDRAIADATAYIAGRH